MIGWHEGEFAKRAKNAHASGFGSDFVNIVLIFSFHHLLNINYELSLFGGYG